jgi:hypothetical protein
MNEMKGRKGDRKERNGARKEGAQQNKKEEDQEI